MALGTSPRAEVLEIGEDGLAHRFGGGWDRPPAANSSSRQPATFRAEIEAAARATDLSPDFLTVVARSESGFNPRIVSRAGAIGVMQLMPETARQLGVDPWNAAQNIMGGARYLRAQLDRFNGRIDLALAAYNAGATRVVQYGGVPPFRETRTYVERNLDRLAARSLAPASRPGDQP